MKLNKFLRITLTGILFSLTFLSCEKDPAPAPIPTYLIQGLWIGSYSVDGQPGLGQQYYSFVIKPDGTMIGDSKSSNPTQQHITLGTWNLSGSTLSCSITCIYGLSVNIGLTQTCTSTWDNTGKLTGTWRNTSGPAASGTFTMTRVN
jgi:hypothetical protein